MLFTVFNYIYSAGDSEPSFARSEPVRTNFPCGACWRMKYSWKLNHYSSGQPLTAPGRWGYQNFQTIGAWRWQGCQPYAPAAFTLRRLKGEVHGNNPHTEDDPKHSIQNAVLAFHQQNVNVQWEYLSCVTRTGICKPKQTIYAMSKKRNINCNPNSRQTGIAAITAHLSVMRSVLNGEWSVGTLEKCILYNYKLAFFLKQWLPVIFLTQLEVPTISYGSTG